MYHIGNGGNKLFVFVFVFVSLSIEYPRYIEVNELYRNLKHIFQEMKLQGLISYLYIHVSVSDLYIPTMGPRQTDGGNK